MDKKLNKFSASAILIAVAFLLNMIRIIRLPFGGSITMFSMLFISLPAYFYGLKMGFISAFAFSLLQLITDFYVIHPMQLILDYILAFTCFGVVGFFNNKHNGLIIGYIVACILRFLISSISGYIFFKEYAPEAWNPLVYTIVYNASYIFTECIITVIVMLLKPVKNVIMMIKNKTGTN